MKNNKARKLLDELLYHRQRELADYQERTLGDRDKDRASFIMYLKKEICEVKEAVKELNNNEYLFDSIEDFEDSMSYQVTDSFRNAWNIARSKRRVLNMIINHEEIKQ